MTPMTRSQQIATDVTALMRARNPLLWVVTREEARVERYLIEAAIAAKYVPRMWDVAQGVTDLSGAIQEDLAGPDPGAIFTTIKNRAGATKTDRGVWIMRDLPPWLTGFSGAAPLRQLCNLARSLPRTDLDSAQVIVIITPITDVPPELRGHVTMIEWPLPDRTEIGAILDAAVNAISSESVRNAALSDGRETAIDAAVGLSGDEADGCYARSLIQFKTIDPKVVAQEKKRIITRERVLEWFDPLPEGLDGVGGLDELKSWLVKRQMAYGPEARAFGLPSPKGIFIVGISGCGKSLTAKAVAAAWGIPLLRIDLGALRSKFVGESEGNLRRALRVIEAIGRCVVWFDEIEKALQGANNAADGGVSSDAVGAVLSWMQERRGEAFVVATANDVQALPPELLRKGRFDEMWWVDLPNQKERVEVLLTALRAHGRGNVEVNLNAVATACDQYSGAEIAAIVPDALFDAFGDGAREIVTDDLLTAAKRVVPLSSTASEKLKESRKWAQGRARPATSPYQEEALTRRDGRVLDL